MKQRSLGYFLSAPNGFAKTMVLFVMLLRAVVVVGWSNTARTFSSPARSKNIPRQPQGVRSILRPQLLHSSSTDIEEDVVAASLGQPPKAFLAITAHSGLTDEEVSVLVETVEHAYSETVGLAGVSCVKNASSGSNAMADDENRGHLVGALCRVLALRTNLDDETKECLRARIAERVDHHLFETGELQQPVLVSVQTTPSDGGEVVDAIVEREIEAYGLRTPLQSKSDNGSGNQDDTDRYTPALRIELDGAETLVESTGESFWDTSSLLVFDNLMDDDLRRRLLDVVNGKPASPSPDWNDVQDGPDPNRWIRGGLLDVPDDSEDAVDEEEQAASSCWGLPTEAIEDLCFGTHPAIQDFEAILTKLFPQFVVCRLPEAVYGDSVSPLTANAPVAGEESLYDYHIDGDPLQTPPSPWTDVYGRYPNRAPGKPRFVSCIVYLNEEWQAEQWGAPTKFFDPPTQESYELLPAPGRCVFLDQDLGHTVTPPNSSAGKRPRYSLVWKLVLHPKSEGQDMTDLSGNASSSWPEPILFGSAAMRSN